MYAQLNTTTNFTFLTGASHPQELVSQAVNLHYRALAITDECSLAGIVKAYQRHKELLKSGLPKDTFKLIYGSRFKLTNGCQIIALAPNRKAYAELSGFITLTRRRAPKGEYEAHMEDLQFRLQHCFIIWQADHVLDTQSKDIKHIAKSLTKTFKQRIWLGINQQLLGGEQHFLYEWQQLGGEFNIPLVASGEVLMHEKARKPLQDTLCAIRENTSINLLGTQLQSNAEAYLKPINRLRNFYPQPLLEEANLIADACTFSLSELRYQYPPELVPTGISPIQHLRNLVDQGKTKRYPQGVPIDVENTLEKELALIEELEYEFFFLTVHDITRFATQKNIFYQGRGSAANSVVCYCLHITNISPEHIQVLFERFISKERDEPPDIDVDFESQRREEVIQYIYEKYDREHAAIAATVITYRTRSAIRDVGKALGLDASLIEHLSKSLAWWDRTRDLEKRIEAAGLDKQKNILVVFFNLVQQILGFPRHLSQHVGGFVITKDRISDLVPLENASMAERTVIQWDKEDLETMGLLKVDVLSLGMLTALHKACDDIHRYDPSIIDLSSIPKEDPATYEMLCAGDSLGVFQVESRAQMSMLPRLKPRKFYDLVIQIAIIRPGPIQGDMVHPYLRRRNNEEKVSYFNGEIKSVLERTNGIPIFQEQAIRLSMVAAGFSGGEADELRRAMASWGKNGNLLKFENKFLQGMQNNGYPEDFAERLFEQIKGFGGYGFPESHSASFALLCYASSWLKYHHPAAFYCALLNSQPMGFYSPSQLIQDAKRHNIKVLAIDINKSDADNSIELVSHTETDNRTRWGIRLGLNKIKSLNKEAALRIVKARQNTPFKNLQDFNHRTQLTANELQHLASADALRDITGNRHIAHWQTSAIPPFNSLLNEAESSTKQNKMEDLFTDAPSVEKNVVDDYATTGLSLREHPMSILRNEYPFNRCKTHNELNEIDHGRFVRVAGLVTGRQRPGTAKGTIFLTLEDETGNINVVVWKRTQEHFRQALLTSKLLLVKGIVELSRDKQDARYSVIHVVAGQLVDYSQRLSESFNLKSRDFH